MPQDHRSTPAPALAAGAVVSEDLFTLTLADGLPAVSEGQQLRYKRVRLRETGVGDERQAQRLAERVVLVGGVHRLLVSDADFHQALTMLHIEGFECDGQQIGRAVIDLELVGKLSSHDWGLIEQRVFLIEMAAQVRYGELAAADFDAIMSGQKAVAALSPQRGGQAAGLGQAAAEPGPGPALLADFAGAPADGTPAGDAR